VTRLGQQRRIWRAAAISGDSVVRLALAVRRRPSCGIGAPAARSRERAYEEREC